MLARAPKTRPDATVQMTAARLTEEQLLRRQLAELRIEHRKLTLRKNEEIRLLLEQQRTVTEEIPEAIAKEERLATLLDQINSFLHYGTVVRVIQDAKRGVIVRQFLHLTTDKGGATKIAWSPVDEKGKKQRDSIIDSISISDCKRVMLGQFGDAFKQFPRSEEIQAASRMSFTVVCKKKVTIDVVCGNEADFEAWIVALNKMIGTAAEWPNPLDVNGMPHTDDLDAEERQFCAVVNVTPEAYLRAKSAVARRGSKILTLFDVRATTGLDLYHSQRLFFFLRCRGWICQATVFYPTAQFAGSVFQETEVTTEVVDDDGRNGDAPAAPAAGEEMTPGGSTTAAPPTTLHT